MSPLRLGTRGSDLALWQARTVAGLLEQHLGLEAEIEVIKTRGDRIQNVAFAKMEGKGFFTKELQEALFDRRIDLVVHSLKDLPTESPEGLEVIAIPERANPADLLLARKHSLEITPGNPMGLADGAVLGTSSLRRAAQALALRPGLQVKALRGNVPTRIRKLRDGEYDAILLAAAGVGRLEIELDDLDTLELPPEVMLPAPGQGALAIECRAGDPLTRPLAALDDGAVAAAVGAERSLLHLLGGGCHLPLGCLATVVDGETRLQAVLGDIDDEVTAATVARVAAVSPRPEIATKACFEALKTAMPHVVSS
ncbi:MAG: hydroxymethylbilane synthase [Thermoanaerobaculales bacterium]|jgi:hydroxymethylbilane synthase|nr:hydroxymethylbilane synthase [Thermoanaerobaculales bacterium]